jgi:hypothetical protein
MTAENARTFDGIIIIEKRDRFTRSERGMIRAIAIVDSL